MRRLPRIATHKFFYFHIKNVILRTFLINFTVQYCFLFRFVCIELVSLIWFLQIWVAIYVYGTMTNRSTLIKKLMQTYIVKVSGSILNISTVHLNGIWHLIWRYLSKPVLGGHPVLSGHYSIPWGCPLNTGFTVVGIVEFCLRPDPSSKWSCNLPGWRDRWGIFQSLMCYTMLIKLLLLHMYIKGTKG